MKQGGSVCVVRRQQAVQSQAAVATSHNGDFLRSPSALHFVLQKADKLSVEQGCKGQQRCEQATG